MGRTEKSKVVTPKELLLLVNKWREKRETIVFTNGVFDILHAGHLSLFEACSQFGDHLVVGVNSDRSARRLNKGDDRPYVNEQDRIAMVAALSVVDAAVLFDEDTPRELLRLLKPDVLAKGADYAHDEIVGREFAARTERIRLKDGYSTSSLIDRIRGDKSANDV